MWYIIVNISDLSNIISRLVLLYIIGLTVDKVNRTVILFGEILLLIKYHSNILG